MDNRITIPIKRFENTNETLNNTNFHKVKIVIMHTGENYNESIFSEDSIDVSIDTLSNIPILGYVHTDDSGNRDFQGHEVDMDIFTDEDGIVKIKEYYKEQPIGVIPETNDWFKEEIDGEIYLGCYGYVWKCYSNDAYDILLEDEEKEVSMEILLRECSYDKKNRCNINSFEFLGVTILGARVPGAMGSECTLNMNFSTDKENEEFSKTVDKLNNLLKHRKEDVSMEKEVNFEENKEEEVCPECGKNPCECDKEDFEDDKEKGKDKDEEVCPECGKNPCECDKEDFEDDKVKDEDDNKGEDDAEDKDEEVCPECGKNPCECDKENASKKKKKCSTENKEEFALSLNNTFKAIREYLEDFTFEYESYFGDTYECEKYYVEDLIPENLIAILYDREDGKNYGVKYSVVKDEVSLDLNSKVEYIEEWREKNTSSSRFSLDECKKFKKELCDKFINELFELRKFKSNIEEKENQIMLESNMKNILTNFSFDEDDENVSKLKQKVLNREMDLERFEEKLCVLEVKKQRLEKEKFSKTVENNGLKIVDINEDEKPKQKYSSILEKYGKKNK